MSVHPVRVKSVKNKSRRAVISSSPRERIIRGRSVDGGKRHRKTRLPEASLNLTRSGYKAGDF